MTTEEKISKLEAKIKTLKDNIPLYKEGDTLMLISNKLKVRVHKIMKDKRYLVFYPHMYNKACKGNDWFMFPVKESELETVPYDYNIVIFKAYIELLSKYHYLINDIYSGSETNERKQN